MLRGLIALVAAVSVILCAISAVFWMRSYSNDSRWETYRGGRLYSVRTVTGRFTMCWMEGMPWQGGFGAPNGKSFNTALTRAQTTYGFGLAHSDWSDPTAASQLAVEFPLWFATAAFALLPLLWLITLRRRRPTGAGCSRCGYDLTDNTSGTCPECGTTIPAKPGAGHPVLSAPTPAQSAS